MRIKIQPNSVDAEALKEKIAAQFPDYEIVPRGKKFFAVKASGTAGCNIAVQKKAVSVAGNFPTMGGQMLFALSVVLLGFLIPLIVYFAAFHGKMKKVENEVGAFIQSII